MATVRPFRALRPAPALASQVISLPYDVMNREEAAAMAKGNPHSFLHICRSEIDLPEVSDPYQDVVYEKARTNIADFLSRGTLLAEEKPMFYLYQQIMDGRSQLGIVGCASIDEYLNDTIKKHEYTRVEKELDRIRHFDVCNTNTEPVFLTYRDDARIRTICEGWTQSHAPVYDFQSDDGIRHTLWTVEDDGTIQNLVKLFGEIKALYIADGHHRSASAVKVGLKRREEHPDYTGSEEFNYFMAVIFPDADLKIFDYNRVVKDLAGLSKDAFLARLAEVFELSDPQAEVIRPDSKHVFSMFLDGSWYRLKAKPDLIRENDIIKSLDVSILQDLVLEPILGIQDPRTDKRIDFVGGIRGLGELERRVKEDMAVAFALYPVVIGDLLAVSDQGMVMPPKSTWFEPKLGSGLFLHPLS